MAAGWMARRYLERLHVGRTGPPDQPLLSTLHRRHLEAVPFENLSIHLAEPVVLDEVEMVAKVVDRHRGGFCYELNGAFAWLLRRLGYQVEFLEAAVFREDGTPGPHFDHMVLRVQLDRPCLADVGFGDNHLDPLLAQTGLDQIQPEGVFRLDPVGDDADIVDLVRDVTPQYRLSLRPHPLTAFEGMCAFHQSPESHLTRSTICSRLTPRGRVTIRGRRLIVTEAGQRRQEDLDDEQLLACYRDTFGISLPALPSRSE